MSVSAILIIGVTFCAVAAALFARANARKLEEVRSDKRRLIEELEQHASAVYTVQSEAATRVQEAILQDSLLHAVNDVAAMLLGSDAESFDRTLFSCMGRMGTSVGVDRVYIWKNHMQEEGLYTTQIHEWSGGAEPQQGNELTVSVPFPEAWYPNLSTNRCVNGPVSAFPDYERDHLMAQGIVSIIVVPVFLHGEFWGFVGFDDCHSERSFSEGEEAILRSVSLLFATSQLRNEMTVSIMNAKEDALANSRAKTDFLATMSHEIRTPINAITGMVSIARMSEDKKKVLQCLNRIDAASRQLLSLVNDVLDMSKIESGKLELAHEPFELEFVLNNTTSIIGVRAAEKKQIFNLEIDPVLPAVVVGDDVRITQVLINLLSNAVKFTPDGGAINLSVKRVGGKTEAGKEFDELEFVVCDTGIGIKDADKERLFSKFEQADRGTSRRFGGSGLGLSICKSIVELMGGSIEVESEPGKGSCFTVRFFIERGRADDLAPIYRSGDVQSYDFAGHRALLVEDIDINREIVITLLDDTGLIIDEARDGQVAVDMFKASPEHYDIIFMDIHMPVKDGYGATREIRALGGAGAEVPIIAMTANAFSEDVQQCLDAGMDDHISKPVNFDILTEKIAAYFLRGR